MTGLLALTLISSGSRIRCLAKLQLSPFSYPGSLFVYVVIFVQTFLRYFGDWLLIQPSLLQLVR